MNEWKESLAIEKIQPQKTGASLVVPNAHFDFPTAETVLDNMEKLQKIYRYLGTEINLKYIAYILISIIISEIHMFIKCVEYGWFVSVIL